MRPFWPSIHAHRRTKTPKYIHTCKNRATFNQITWTHKMGVLLISALCYMVFGMRLRICSTHLLPSRRYNLRRTRADTHHGYTCMYICISGVHSVHKHVQRWTRCLDWSNWWPSSCKRLADVRCAAPCLDHIANKYYFSPAHRWDCEQKLYSIDTTHITDVY